MWLGYNKVLKITWCSGHSASSGNWTVNWFVGWGLLRHFSSLGIALRFLGASHFSRFFRRWHLQRGTGSRRTESRCRNGVTFWQASQIRLVEGIRVVPNAFWLLTASEASSISSEDLSILNPDFIWSHIYFLLYTSFELSTRYICRLYTHNVSFA